MRKYLLFTLLSILLLSACNKVTQANFDKIRDGMTTTEVQTILGEPTETSSVDLGIASGTTSNWKSKDGAVISIQFVNGKVRMKNFTK